MKHTVTIMTRTNKNGHSYRLRFRHHRKPVEISLPSGYTKIQANKYARLIEEILMYDISECPPSKTLLVQLESLPKTIVNKFVSAGLIAREKVITIKNLFDDFLRHKPELKLPTVTKHLETYNRLIESFPSDTDVTTITVDDCIRWKQHSLSRFAEATVAGHIKNLRAVWALGVTQKHVETNVWSGIGRGSFKNKSREHFVTREDYIKLLDACPNQSWRTLISLCRIGGLRNKSETKLLQWNHVNWAAKSFMVTSPKTAGHEGHDTRMVPLFHELATELNAQWELAPEGSVYVVPRETFRNYNDTFERIIFRAGLNRWERLFQNLRVSRSNEIFSQYPVHVASEWMGQSLTVATAHYLHVTEEQLRSATEPPADIETTKQTSDSIIHEVIMNK